MRWPGALREAVGRMLPWPSRAERHAAIDAAKAERETSRAGREHAKAVEQQIRELARANHFAQAIADDIIRGHRHRRTNGETG